jgi:predicted nucleic acid-binding protein
LAVGDADRGPEALNLYLDSSALGKLIIAEPGSEVVESLWIDADDIACISIGYVEVRAMIARRLVGRATARARRELDERWDGVDEVAVDDRLVELATRITDRYRLRALDSLHLAAAHLIGDADLAIATWDGDLRRAARQSGLATILT